MHFIFLYFYWIKSFNYKLWFDGWTLSVNMTSMNVHIRYLRELVEDTCYTRGLKILMINLYDKILNLNFIFN